MTTLTKLKEPRECLAEQNREFHGRIESGAMCFGEDWPGVFFRGDNALAFAIMLQAVIPVVEKSDLPFFTVDMLKGLMSDLNSCDANLLRKEGLL